MERFTPTFLVCIARYGRSGIPGTQTTGSTHLKRMQLHLKSTHTCQFKAFKVKVHGFGKELETPLFGMVSRS